MHIVVNAAIANQLSQDKNSQRALVLGGIAPDMDVFLAWILILIPQLFILQHRGLFHTVFAAPFIIIPLILSTKYYKRINFIKKLKEPLQELQTEFNYKTVIWGTFGVFIHLILDTITAGGLQLFYPFIQQRITFNLISMIDPLIALLSGVVVLRFIYNKLISSSAYSFSHFNKSARSVCILFIVLLSAYSVLQVNTVITHSPNFTKPELIPIFRWVYTEDESFISIQLVNQLTQEIIRTYHYTSLTFNQSGWDIITITSIVNQAKETVSYENFKFRLESEAYVAINATFNKERNGWEISFLDTFQDAQLRFYGFPTIPFRANEVIIFLNQT